MTDIGIEEMTHWEIIGALIYKITERATPEELKKAGICNRVEDYIWSSDVFYRTGISDFI